MANRLWPGKPQAVVALEDERRGERMVYVAEDDAPDLGALRQAMREEGLPDFYCPRQFLSMKIPLTPIGKVNFPQLIIDAKAAAAASGAGNS